MNTSDLRFEVPAQVMARNVGEETVILDLASGTYFGLDAVGARFWQLAEQGRGLAEMCDQLMSEYQVDRASLEADLVQLSKELMERGLLATRPPTP